MNERNRMRVLWTMAAMVVVYALVNVIVYFVSGSFGTGWFVASLAVYGLVLVGAIMLLVVDREPASEAVREPAPEEAPDEQPEGSSVRVEVVDPEAAPEPVRAAQ